jgi:transcriptional regulator with XRE-family HTH domain
MSFAVVTDDTATDDPSDLSPLQQLIWSYRERTGESFAVIARRAGVARQTISKVAHSNSVPRVSTLDALARGLLVPESDVYELAAATIRQRGHQSPTDGLSAHAIQMVRLMESLSPADAVDLLRLAQSFQDAVRRRRHLR